VAEKRQEIKVNAWATDPVLKILALIAESGNVQLPHLRIWQSVQYEFMANMTKNVGTPNCAESAEYFVAT
jgi:hypothetical protein